jgi:hypothetical protein
MSYVAPRGLDGVGKSSSTLINELIVVIDGTVRVTLRVEIPVRRLAITDDRTSVFDRTLITVI